MVSNMYNLVLVIALAITVLNATSNSTHPEYWVRMIGAF